MNEKQFEFLMCDTFENLEAISETKGREYAHDADRLANFKRLAVELNMAPEQVLWVMFTKHKDSIVSYIRPEQTKPVLSEPIEGRIDDAILYLILLKGLLRERGGLPKAADAVVDLPRIDPDKLQRGWERGSGPVGGNIGYRIVGGGKVVPEAYTTVGDSDGARPVLHKAAGTMAEDGGPGVREEGRGDVADWHPV